MVRKIKIPVVPTRDNYEQKTLQAILKCLEKLANLNLDKRSNMVAFLLQTPPLYSKKVSRY